jgi:hypothetical protein
MATSPNKQIDLNVTTCRFNAGLSSYARHYKNADRLKFLPIGRHSELWATLLVDPKTYAQIIADHQKNGGREITTADGFRNAVKSVFIRILTDYLKSVKITAESVATVRNYQPDFSSVLDQLIGKTTTKKTAKKTAKTN